MYFALYLFGELIIWQRNWSTLEGRTTSFIIRFIDKDCIQFFKSYIRKKPTAFCTNKDTGIRNIEVQIGLQFYNGQIRRQSKIYLAGRFITAFIHETVLSQHLGIL